MELLGLVFIGDFRTSRVFRIELKRVCKEFGRVSFISSKGICRDWIDLGRMMR